MGRVVATMDGRLVDGNIDLVEFLNGIACFAASSKEEKDQRVRVFAFQMMDLRHEGHIHTVRAPPGPRNAPTHLPRRTT